MLSYNRKHRCACRLLAPPWLHCKKGWRCAAWLLLSTTISGVRTVPLERLRRLGFTWNTLLISILFLSSLYITALYKKHSFYNLLSFSKIQSHLLQKERRIPVRCTANKQLYIQPLLFRATHRTNHYLLFEKISINLPIILSELGQGSS